MKNLCTCACPWKFFLLYVHRFIPNERVSHEQRRQTVLWNFKKFFINKLLQEGKWKRGLKKWDVLNIIRLNAFLKELNENRPRNKEFYYSIRL